MLFSTTNLSFSFDWGILKTHGSFILEHAVTPTFSQFIHMIMTVTRTHVCVLFYTLFISLHVMSSWERCQCMYCTISVPTLIFTKFVFPNIFYVINIKSKYHEIYTTKYKFITCGISVDNQELGTNQKGRKVATLATYTIHFNAVFDKVCQ